jgi:hypothetical protein
MCYGARCAHYRRAQVDHSGRIDPDDLKTSFAYKLFKEIAPERNLKLTAVTGKVQHNATTGHALVEHEDLVDEDMDVSEARSAYTGSRRHLNQRYALLRSSNSDTRIATEEAKYRANPTLPATTPLEQYAKEVAEWENSGGAARKARLIDTQATRAAALNKLRNTGQEPDMPKYGKFIYTYKKHLLKIVSKYGRRNDPDIRPMTVLYEGPLL